MTGNPRNCISLAASMGKKQPRILRLRLRMTTVELLQLRLGKTFDCGLQDELAG